MTEKLTQEQENILTLSSQGTDLKVSAYAGTGKTFTLKQLTKKVFHKKQGIYLAFNKAIATEAQKKFGQNIKTTTFHALAYSQTDSSILKKLTAPRYLPEQAIKDFGLKNIPIVDQLTRKTIDFTAYKQFTVINQSITMFCRDNAKYITKKHVEDALPEWINLSFYNSSIVTVLLPHVIKYWEMLTDDTTQIKISHDIYLKLWAMSSPMLNTDYILIDEAQDSDPIMLQILKNQSCQRIFVGDKFQSIYGFRGAENAMQRLLIPEARLTQSFRFGDKIADQGNLILSTILKEKIPLIGNPSISSFVGGLESPSAILVRNNASAFKIALEKLLDNKKVRLELDTETLKKNLQDAIKLKANENNLDINSEFFGFRDWASVLQYAEENELDSLSALAKLIEKETPEKLLFVLNRLDEVVDQKDIDCIVSTAHKSKGLEYSSVQIYDDFKFNRSFNPLIGKNCQQPLMTEDEARLLYVAVTRAEHQLDVQYMSKFFGLLKKGHY